MIMKWFELQNEQIWLIDDLLNERYRYGMRLGKRWCLDFTVKLLFGIPNDVWETRCKNLKTDQDFYDLCDWLGIYYMKDNVIYMQGEKYNKYGNKL